MAKASRIAPEFAKGCPIEHLAVGLGLSRTMTDNLLAGIYQKVGIRDAQELLNAIEAFAV